MCQKANEEHLQGGIHVSSFFDDFHPVFSLMPMKIGNRVILLMANTMPVMKDVIHKFKTTEECLVIRGVLISLIDGSLWKRHCKPSS